MRSARLSLPAPLFSYPSLSKSVPVQQEEVKYQMEAPLWGRLGKGYIQRMGSKLLISLSSGKCYRTYRDQGAQTSEWLHVLKYIHGMFSVYLYLP